MWRCAILLRQWSMVELCCEELSVDSESICGDSELGWSSLRTESSVVVDVSLPEVEYSLLPTRQTRRTISRQHRNHKTTWSQPYNSVVHALSLEVTNDDLLLPTVLCFCTVSYRSMTGNRRKLSAAVSDEVNQQVWSYRVHLDYLPYTGSGEPTTREKSEPVSRKWRRPELPSFWSPDRDFQ